MLFNTNGTLLNPRKLPRADRRPASTSCASRSTQPTRKTYEQVRGKDFFDRIVRDVRLFTDYQRSAGATTPRVSLWLTGLKETVQQLPEFVRLAAEMGVREVHLQRLVFDETGFGMARADNSLFEQTVAEEQAIIAAAEAVGAELGVTHRRVGRYRARPQPEARRRQPALVDCAAGPGR